MNGQQLISLMLMVVNASLLSMERPPTRSNQNSRKPAQELRVAESTKKLIDAVLGNDAGAVEAALGEGADITVRNEHDDHCTLLHHAAGEGFLDVVRCLIAHEAEIDARTLSREQTPLHRAVYRGQIGVAELLLDHGANVEAVCSYGIDPLNFALSSVDSSANAAMAELIIKRHPNLGQQYNFLLRSVQLAFCNAHYNGPEPENLVSLLLDLGARTDSASTLVRDAFNKGFYNIVKLLIIYGASLLFMEGDVRNVLAQGQSKIG